MQHHTLSYRRDETDGSQTWVIVGAVLIAVAGAAVGSVMAFSGGNERSLGEDERNSAEYFNFDTPIVDGVKVASVDAAKSVLPFDPVTPDQISAPVSTFVREEAAPAQQILGLVYEDPKYGQFVMIESQISARKRSWSASLSSATSRT
jgi:hypothetical protein